MTAMNEALGVFDANDLSIMDTAKSRVLAMIGHHEGATELDLEVASLVLDAYSSGIKDVGELTRSVTDLLLSQSPGEKMVS